MLNKTAAFGCGLVFYVNSSIVRLVLVQTRAFWRMRQSASMWARHHKVFMTVNYNICEEPFSTALVCSDHE